MVLKVAALRCEAFSFWAECQNHAKIHTYSHSYAYRRRKPICAGSCVGDLAFFFEPTESCTVQLTRFNRRLGEVSMGRAACTLPTCHAQGPPKMLTPSAAIVKFFGTGHCRGDGAGCTNTSSIRPQYFPTSGYSMLHVRQKTR